MRSIAEGTGGSLGRLRFERTNDVPGVLWGSTHTILRCHENGVELTIGTNVRQLLFSHLAGFCFAMIDHYAPQGYAGTEYHLEFCPHHGDAADPALIFAFYTTPIKNDSWWPWTPATKPILVLDKDLEALRDDLTTAISERMVAEIVRHGAVAWTNGIRITRAGIEYPVSRNGMALLPLREIDQCSAVNGEFYLRQRGSANPVAQIPTISLNFFPGLEILKALLQSGQEALPMPGSLSRA